MLLVVVVGIESWKDKAAGAPSQSAQLQVLSWTFSSCQRVDNAMWGVRGRSTFRCNGYVNVVQDLSQIVNLAMTYQGSARGPRAGNVTISLMAHRDGTCRSLQGLWSRGLHRLLALHAHETGTHGHRIESLVYETPHSVRYTSLVLPLIIA
jgi:hypothetical protein